MKFESFYNDLLQLIYSFLTLSSFASLSSTCHYLNQSIRYKYQHYGLYQLNHNLSTTLTQHLNGIHTLIIDNLVYQTDCDTFWDHLSTLINQNCHSLSHITLPVNQFDSAVTFINQFPKLHTLQNCYIELEELEEVVTHLPSLINFGLVSTFYEFDTESRDVTLLSTCLLSPSMCNLQSLTLHLKWNNFGSELNFYPLSIQHATLTTLNIVLSDMHSFIDLIIITPSLTHLDVLKMHKLDRQSQPFQSFYRSLANMPRLKYLKSNCMNASLPPNLLDFDTEPEDIVESHTLRVLTTPNQSLDHVSEYYSYHSDPFFILDKCPCINQSLRWCRHLRVLFSLCPDLEFLHLYDSTTHVPFHLLKRYFPKVSCEQNKNTLYLHKMNDVLCVHTFQYLLNYAPSAVTELKNIKMYTNYIDDNALRMLLCKNAKTIQRIDLENCPNMLLNELFSDYPILPNVRHFKLGGHSNLYLNSGLCPIDIDSMITMIPNVSHLEIECYIITESLIDTFLVHIQKLSQLIFVHLHFHCCFYTDEHLYSRIISSFPKNVQVLLRLSTIAK